MEPGRLRKLSARVQRALPMLQVVKVQDQWLNHSLLHLAHPRLNLWMDRTPRSRTRFGKRTMQGTKEESHSRLIELKVLLISM